MFNLRDATQTPVLAVQDLAISFGRHFALEDITFSVPAGELLGITGPNGSGKTTIINIISGILKPQRGQVYLHGKNITRLKPHQRVRRGMARTFQHARHFPEMSAYENVLLAALKGRMKLPAGRKGEQIEDKIADVLNRTYLYDQRHVPAGRLSSGCLRRLDIARALATSPELLILDEPFAALSVREEKNLLKLLKDLKAEGLTMLIVSHRLDILSSLADRLLVMAEGKQSFIGDPAEALSRAPQQKVKV